MSPTPEPELWWCPYLRQRTAQPGACDHVGAPPGTLHRRHAPIEEPDAKLCVCGATTRNPIHATGCLVVDANRPPRPGESVLAAIHARAIIQAGIAVAMAAQVRQEATSMDELLVLTAGLELAVRKLTEVCVEAQVASNARWS